MDITGIIYCLKSNQTDKIYIGSSTLSLKKRFSLHKNAYKKYYDKRKYSSFELLKYDDCYIELIKIVCCSRKNLYILEGQEIMKNEKCINKLIAGNMIKFSSIIAYNKQHETKKYSQEEINETKKHNEKTYMKKYLKTEKYKNYQKEYNKNRNLCNCGGFYKMKHKNEHEKTNKHKKYLCSINI